MTDPRMSLTLKDCLISTPQGEARRRELERRRTPDPDAAYLGPRRPAAELREQTEDEWIEEVAAGVAAGLKAKGMSR